jgi:hypothetical protein
MLEKFNLRNTKDTDSCHKNTDPTMIILLHRFKNNICMFFFPVKFNILNTFFERLGGRGEWGG